MKPFPVRPVAWLLIAIAVATTVLCYQKGLNGGIYFDDAHVLTENEHIRVNSLDPDSLLRAASSFGAGGRELSMLTFGLNHYFFGESIRALKAVNLAIHVVTGVVFFFLARLLMLAGIPGAQRTDHMVFWGPLIAASLWMLFRLTSEQCSI